MQSKVVQQQKKVLKAITLINSDHRGIPAYHFLSFLFSVLYKILLCLLFLTVFSCCPARPLAYELRCFLHFAGLHVSLSEQEAVGAGNWG